MDYSTMSDQEINMAIASMFFPDDIVIESKSRPPSACITGHPSRWVDYCNNEVDAWPIIIDNKLSLNNYGDSWEASFEHDEPVGAFGTDECVTSGIEDKNPLRALMIAFLMKVEIENAKIPSERDS